MLIWAFTVFLVSGPLRVPKGSDGYLWMVIGVLVAGYVAGFAIGYAIERLALRPGWARPERR